MTAVLANAAQSAADARLPSALDELLTAIRACRACAASLPLPPRPVLRAHSAARILIASQAPGVRVHTSGIPWNDPSGARLREWLGVSTAEFHDCTRFAIIPMGFCYPGRLRSGDAPPRRECAPLWLDKLLAQLPRIDLTLLVGGYAQRHFLGKRCRPSLTETVRAWRDYLPDYLPLPHPSPRNQGWLKHNPWFADELLPALRTEVRARLRAD